ncbi:MAG: hypothetical protein ACUVV5_12780 [Candidatus Aminicenantales bacterium]
MAKEKPDRSRSDSHSHPHPHSHSHVQPQSPSQPHVLRPSPLLEEKDILSGLIEEKSSSLFLGRYSLTEVASVLGKRNFFKEARRRNLWPLVFNLDSSEYPIQRYRIFLKEAKPANLIVDLKIREGRLKPRSDLSLPAEFFDFEFLILEWLTLQNPLLQFCRKRPPLPGQERPGLGLGKKVVDVFIYLARLTHKDGVLAFPAYFHNALLFTRYFNFLNPEKQGEVLAIEKAFPDIPFKHLAWIVYLNCLREERLREEEQAGEEREGGEKKEEGAEVKTYEWMAEEQVYPLNRSLKEHFESKWYKQKVKDIINRRRFFIDWICYEKKVDELIAGKGG